MPKLTIDGREIEVEPGTTVIRAADRLGIYVPHYCWHPGLTVAGNCRMCLVDIEKAPKLSIACSTQAADGMVVRTTGPKVKEAQDAILEFLLINHPLDCPICDEAGECRLQEYAFRYGPARSRFLEEKVHKPKRVDIGKHIVFDGERCIVCTRCVRFCQEVTHTGELTVSQRSDHVTIETFPGMRLDNAYSGNTVDICPVGALTLKEFRFKQRVWFLRDVHSVCPGCARGCNVIDGVSKGRILRITPRTNLDVNRWWICDEGRLSFQRLYRPGRIQWARLTGKYAARAMSEGEFAAVSPRIARGEGAGGSEQAPRGTPAVPGQAPPTVAEASTGTSPGGARQSAPPPDDPLAPGTGAGSPGSGGGAASTIASALRPLEESPDETTPYVPMLNEGIAPAPRPAATLRQGEAPIAVALDAAARALDEARTAGGPGGVEFLLSSRATNEDLYLLARLAREQFGVTHVSLPVHERGENDDLLIRKDKTPNRRGALEILHGLGLSVEDGSLLVGRLRSGAVRALVALGPNLRGVEDAPAMVPLPGYEMLADEPGSSPYGGGLAPGAALPGYETRVGGEGSGSEADAHSERVLLPGYGMQSSGATSSGPSGEGRGRGEAGGIDEGDSGDLFDDIASAAQRAAVLLVAIDAFDSPMTARAQIVLPALTAGEVEGTVTNFQGRVQRVRSGLAPAADGLPVFRIAQEIARRLGLSPGRPGAQETFTSLAAEIPAFAGLSYAKVGDYGAMLTAPGLHDETSGTSSESGDRGTSSGPGQGNPPAGPSGKAPERTGGQP